ncbi:MAG: hypothetical protein QG656_953 [Candidatus Hydrogenedentes bacterium]|nr:hypothetical protein [Candidatus Hydrogenedentota bacterium]
MKHKILGLVLLLSATVLTGCPIPHLLGTWSMDAVYTGTAGTEYQERWVLSFYLDAKQTKVKWTKAGLGALANYTRKRDTITIDGTFNFPGGGSWRLTTELELDDAEENLSGPFTLTLITPHPGDPVYTGTMTGVMVAEE